MTEQNEISMADLAAQIAEEQREAGEAIDTMSKQSGKLTVRAFRKVAKGSTVPPVNTDYIEAGGEWVRMFMVHAMAVSKGAYKAIQALLGHTGIMGGTGFYGSLTAAAMVVSRYMTVGKDGSPVFIDGDGDGALLAALTGAVKPLAKSGYHREKGYFDANGQLTASGAVWQAARFAGKDDSDRKGAYFATPAQTAAFIVGFRDGGIVRIPDANGDKSKGIDVDFTGAVHMIRDMRVKARKSAPKPSKR